MDTTKPPQSHLARSIQNQIPKLPNKAALAHQQLLTLFSRERRTEHLRSQFDRKACQLWPLPPMQQTSNLWLAAQWARLRMLQAILQRIRKTSAPLLQGAHTCWWSVGSCLSAKPHIQQREHATGNSSTPLMPCSLPAEIRRP